MRASLRQQGGNLIMAGRAWVAGEIWALGKVTIEKDWSECAKLKPG